MSGELTHNQLKAINSLIKKELEKKENSSTEFVYYKDLYVLLEDKLKSLSSPPFTSISSLTRYFKGLESKNSLHSIPYLYREKKNSKWKFYKIEHKPILEKGFVSDWVDSLYSKIHIDGLIYLSEEDLPSRKSLLNSQETIAKEIIELERSDSDQTDLDKINIFKRKLIELNTLLEREIKFFEHNLGVDIEYNEANKKRLIFKLICERNKNVGHELSECASIIY